MARLAKGKFHLTFPEQLIREPVIYSLGKRFGLVTNIRRANVDPEEGQGWVILEMEGAADALTEAAAWLIDRGVHVERLPDEDNGGDR
jgi:ABC-type methionine transport system ATPase subunit